MDYPNLWGYLRDLYQTPGFGDTTNRFHIEHHYQVSGSLTESLFNIYTQLLLLCNCDVMNIQESHLQINPKGIVAIGPDLDFNQPHNRATRFS